MTIESEARYVLDCGDRLEQADIGYELCLYEEVAARFPDLTARIVAATIDERADLSIELARELGIEVEQ